MDGRWCRWQQTKEAKRFYYLRRFKLALKEIEKWNSVNSIISVLDNAIGLLTAIQEKNFFEKPDANLDEIVEMLDMVREKYKKLVLKTTVRPLYLKL